MLLELRAVDEVVPEKNWDQKSSDINKYQIDILQWVMTGKVNLIF